jgi:hypothetical protein
VLPGEGNCTTQGAVIDEYGALMEIIISKGKRKKLVENPAAVPLFHYEFHSIQQGLNSNSTLRSQP